MILKELYLSFRKNFIINILISIFTFFSLSLFFVLLFFTVQTRVTADQIDNIIDNKRIFHLMEDWREFDQFYGRDDALERLKEFYYNTLINTDDFLTVNLAAHPIEINVDEFKGDETFQYLFEEGLQGGALGDSGGNHFYQIESFQVSLSGWELFPFEMEWGRGFVEDDFGIFKGGSIPVVLGHNYSGIYNIGDRFSAYYKMMDFEFEVVGILARDQSLFNINDGYVYLDKYMIIPYQSFENPQNEEERRFQTFEYLGRALWATLFVDDTPEAIDTMKNTIHAAANDLDIPYTFRNMDDTYVHFQELSNLINHNLNTVNTLFISSIFLLIIIIFMMTMMKYNRRQTVYKTHFLMGTSKNKQLIPVVLENLFFFLIVIILALIYIIFYSGLILTAENISALRGWGLSLRFIFWDILTADIFGRQETLYRMIFYGMGLCLISCLYPIYKINHLYRTKGGESK